MESSRYGDFTKLSRFDRYRFRRAHAQVECKTLGDSCFKTTVDNDSSAVPATACGDIGNATRSVDFQDKRGGVYVLTDPVGYSGDEINVYCFSMGCNASAESDYHCKKFWYEFDHASF